MREADHAAYADAGDLLMTEHLAAAEVIAKLVEALDEALSLFAYVGSCTYECEHRFCKEKRAERDYGLEQLAAARAWQERAR